MNSEQREIDRLNQLVLQRDIEINNLRIDQSKAVPFNNLSAAQDERLAMLAEEAGEIVMAVGKIMRHGYDSYHPDHPNSTNVLELEKEIGDLMAVVREMAKRGDIDPARVAKHTDAKWAKALKWTHHQEKTK